MLVEVDGRPVTLPMLEFLMQARGVAEDDTEAMRALLDELIRLQAMANAAHRDEVSTQPKVRAERMIKDIEVQYIRYLEDFQSAHPVSDKDVRDVYERQLERAGAQRYRIVTIEYPDQAAALAALNTLDEGRSSFEEQMRQADEHDRIVQRTDWIDASQVPPDFGAALAESASGQVVSSLLALEGKWYVARLEDVEELDVPAFEAVREGIRRTLNRQRNQAFIDEVFEAAEITPMLPMDQADVDAR
ncbi:MAG: peptidyl-prolyl cis-trans isomerase [Xanthomonadaceae bacterium]|nr:peptidyl-prolyl cis-trans isomerase [Xanthomonadaceae bacterium]